MPSSTMARQIASSSSFTGIPPADPVAGLAVPQGCGGYFFSPAAFSPFMLPKYLKNPPEAGPI